MAKIKLLIMDVDGSLSDGKIHISGTGELFKSFDVKDGYAIKVLLPEAGIQTAIITGRESEIVTRRAEEIGVTYVYQGISDKKEIMQMLQKKLNIEQDEVAYFGDDLNDLPPMQYSGLVGCPSDACCSVKQRADYLCINKAGDGALREFVEWILSSNINEEIIQKRIKYAVEYILSLNNLQLTPGKYVVNGYFYYLVQEYETKPVEKCQLESHKKYTDIQYVLSGEENLTISNTSCLSVKQEYDDGKDLMLWNVPREHMVQMILRPGSCVVLYPENAHMGAISVKNSVKVKKIVGKVSLI